MCDLVRFKLIITLSLTLFLFFFIPRELSYAHNEGWQIGGLPVGGIIGASAGAEDNEPVVSAVFVC